MASEKTRTFSEPVSRAILEAANLAGVAVTVSRVDGENVRNIFVNDAATVIMGRSEHELLERSPLLNVAERERAHMIERLRLRAKGTPLGPSFETTVVRDDGTEIPVQTSVAYVHVDSDLLCVSFYTSLAERKRTEAALRDSERRFRHLIESAPDGVVISQNGQILYLNPAAMRLLGYDHPDELLSKPMTTFLAPDEIQIMRERIAIVQKTRQVLPPREYKATRKDGSQVVAEITSLPIEHEGKSAVIAFARDVTERAKMQEQLARADRLAALGHMAAGVAHEVNNPLGTISLTLEAIDRILGHATLTDEDRSQLNVYFNHIRLANERVADIVRDLKDFSRVDQPAPRSSVDLVQTLITAERMAMHGIRARARIEKTVTDRPYVLGQARRIEQVIINLLLNAAQAFEHDDPRNLISVIVKPLADDRICVEVRDNGPGISKEIQAKIFDPFFTTRPSGGGTGLGLSICHAIVTELGGTITVESEVGQGTTVRVCFLQAQEAPSAPPVAPYPKPVRRARVLIVDDERSLTFSLAALLADDYEVTTANSGDEALKLLLNGKNFDLILCDMVMPRGSGPDVYRRATAARPDLADRFVFMTGGAFTKEAEDFLNEIKNPRLEKPFSLTAVADVFAKLTKQ